MRFGREIDRLLIGLLFCFALVTSAAAYWAVTGADTILRRADNPRRVLAEAAIRRGMIQDRDGAVLVESVSSNGVIVRRYLHPETYSAIGYYSQRYGAGGIEAAFDPLLSGSQRASASDLWQRLEEEVLHLPRRGSDIRLTLELDVQRALANAFASAHGAAVVLSVPDGAVLGMLSQPDFDPNLLDAEWDNLRANPGRPFFNRALQARYQPGSASQTLMMAGALLTRQPLDTPIENAAAPFELDDLTLSCAFALPDLALTLRDAYAFACPSPFAALAEQLDVSGVQGLLETFRIGALPALIGADAANPSQQLLVTSDNLLAEALGQGGWRLTPLEMAIIAAGIVNDGNAPQPAILAAVRHPDSDAWIPADALRPTLPIATTSTARSLQDLMRGAVAFGAAGNAARPFLDIGGHVGLAYAGDQTLAWFIGFVTLDIRRSAVAVVVLENSSDLGLAADIGGTALAQAWDTMQSSSAAVP
jgi:peptidoglycan glycosyltransferase